MKWTETLQTRQIIARNPTLGQEVDEVVVLKRESGKCFDEGSTVLYLEGKYNDLSQVEVDIGNMRKIKYTNWLESDNTQEVSRDY